MSWRRIHSSRLPKVLEVGRAGNADRRIEFAFAELADGRIDLPDGRDITDVKPKTRKTTTGISASACHSMMRRASSAVRRISSTS